MWDPYGATAVVEDAKLRQGTGTPTAAGARRVGIKLVCTFNEVASIVAQTTLQEVVTEVVGAACAAQGNKRPGRPPKVCPLCLTEDAEISVPEGTRGIAEMEVGDRVISAEPASEGALEDVEAGREPSSGVSDGDWLYVPRSGDWVPLTRAPRAGEEALLAGRLVRDGQDVGPASLVALQASDVTWEDAPHHRTPTASTWVLVLGDGLEHAQLRDVAPGTDVAFEGRVLRAMGADRVLAVAPTGQVLARVARTFSRVAPEVIEATVWFEDGTTEVLTATPEHPFHLADEARYAPLREVTKGTRLTTGDGAEAVLVEVERRYGNFEVFNFEVAGQHDYLVGSRDLLVHNAEKCGSGFYIHIFDDGCAYSGKGGKRRSRWSARQRARQLADGTLASAPVRRVVRSIWNAASEDETFLIEAAWMRRLGWDSDSSSRSHGRCFLNQINSPGVRLWATGG